MTQEQGQPPLRLDYQEPSKPQLWPTDPFAPTRVIGIIFGFATPFLFRIWDQWQERIVRVPRLWYQQASSIGIAFLFVVVIAVLFIKRKFSAAFLLGMVIGFAMLMLNYMVEVAFFGVDILGRITGHCWN